MLFRSVDLKDIHILNAAEPGLFQGQRDGLPRADTHEQGRDADDARRDEFTQDLVCQTQALRGAAFHEENGGGAVRDLGGVTRVDGAVLGEGGTDLAEGFDRDAVTDAVIGGDGDGLGFLGLGVGPLDLQGVDFFAEEAFLCGLGGLLVGCSGEFVLFAASDLVVLGHLFRQNAHGDFAVGGLHVVVQEVGEFGDGTGARPPISITLLLKGEEVNIPILQTHALNTSTNTNLNHPRPNSIRNIHHCLQPARALTVQRPHGSRLRETRNQGSSAELRRTTAGREHGADGNILDQLRVDPAALDQALEDTRQQVRRGGVLEATLTTAGDGRAHRSSHNDIIGMLLCDGTAAGLGLASEVGGDLGETLPSC